MLKTGLISKTIAVFVCSSLSNIASAETISEIVNAACRQHPESHTANYLIEEARERVKESRAVVMPNINGTVELGIADDFNAELMTLDNSRPTSTRLTLDQPLFLGGRGRAAIDGAKSQLRSQEFESVSQVLNVQLTAIRAYVNLSRATDLLKVREENLKALKRRKRDSERRFELGAGTITDIVQSEARIERGQAEIISARQDIQDARASLYEATLVSVSGPLALPAKPTLPVSLTQAIEQAARINPSIQSAEALIDAADANVKTIQTLMEPDIRLIGDVSAQRDTAFNGFERDEASVRVRMTVPLFAGGAPNARKRGSLFARNRAYSNRNLAVNRVNESITTAYNQYQASNRLAQINRKLVDVAKRAVESVTKEAEAGFRPQIDTLDAQQELLEAQLALTTARYDEILAAYFYLGAVGSLRSEGFADCERVMPDPLTKTRKPLRKKERHIGFGIKLKEPDVRKRAGPRGK